MFVPVPLLILAGIVFGMLLVLAFRPRQPSRDLMAAPRSQSQYRPIAAQPASMPVNGTLPPEVEAQVNDLLRNDQLIQAIKLVREATGLGLREAKDLAEAMRSSALLQR